MRNVSVSVIIFATFLSSVVHPSNSPGVVSLDEARNLVAAALPLITRQSPGFTIVAGDDPKFSRFYFASLTWAGAPNGSMVIGFYYVDKSTGDVWNAVAEREELSTPALRKLQAKVRLRIRLSDAEYRKIKGDGPFCEQEKCSGETVQAKAGRVKRSSIVGDAGSPLRIVNRGTALL
jgi:hypothetical protein